MSDLDLLIEQLSHNEARIRMSAAKALGQIADEASINALKSVLEDESIAVIRAATLTIGAIGGCEQVTILIPLLEHEELWVRKAAVQAIGMANCQDAVPVLVDLLGHDNLDSLVREALVTLKVDPDFF